jgi:hypothetical protein
MMAIQTRLAQIVPTITLALYCVLLAAMVHGCSSPPSSQVTWRGKTIEVRGTGSASISAGDNQVDITFGSNRVQVTEAAITFNGASKPTKIDKTVLIEVKGTAVTISVDGKLLFP